MKSRLITLYFLFIFIPMNSYSQKEVVSLIVRNGKIYTIDSAFSVAASFAVDNAKIVAVGTDQEIAERYSSDKIIDASGKYVYPGFNDAHSHFNGYAEDLMQYADLVGTAGPDEIYTILENHNKKTGATWVLGRGWDQNDWKVKNFPDKEKLDLLFPDTPVFLIRIDGHAAWCNSKALEIAGITADTKVEGGEVLLKNGEPTGVLIDKAQGLVSKFIPEISEGLQEKGLLAAQKNCFAAGLTSVSDCGLPKKTILLIDRMQQHDSLKIRINAMITPTQENFDYFVKKGSYKTGRLTVNTIKLYADGALGSRGALLLKDYSDDPGNRGLQMEPREYYEKICRMAYDRHYGMAIHCIGDSANRMILEVYGAILKGQNDRRWRIEHAQVINPADFSEFRKYSIVPSIQGTHCTSDMYWAEDRLGPERIKGAYAYQTLLQQNGWLPNGTDFPVEKIDPLLTFYASVFRIDAKGWPPGGWHKDEGLTREQALRSMTIWAAKASFDEKVKGSIEPGKYADFVILDTDLMEATPQEVLKAKVLGTWVGGEKVYGL